MFVSTCRIEKFIYAPETATTASGGGGGARAARAATGSKGGASEGAGWGSRGGQASISGKPAAAFRTGAWVQESNSESHSSSCLCEMILLLTRTMCKMKTLLCVCVCVCVCVPEGGFRGSCWPEGALPFASLQSCTVYLGFQPMQEFRRSVYCLVFGVCMSLAYCSSMCLQMTWCFGVDHICVLLVSMALGSRTQPPQQDPAPIAGPNPPACTCIMQFSCNSPCIVCISFLNYSLQKRYREKTSIVYNMS